MKEKLTEWFDGSEKPVKRGIYQRKFSTERIVFSKWNGREWLYSWGNAGGANQATWKSAAQDLPWRGLAEEPKK